MSSTSVSSPQHYMPPWSFQSAGSDSRLSDRDVRVAWSLLNDAVGSIPGLTIVERDDNALYLRAEGASDVPPTGVDDLEFQMRPPDGIVSFKSESRDTVFVYPVQRPVGCNDCHARRLEELRRRLGWDDVFAKKNYDMKPWGDGETSDDMTIGRFVPLF